MRGGMPSASGSPAMTIAPVCFSDSVPVETIGLHPVTPNVPRSVFARSMTSFRSGIDMFVRSFGRLWLVTSIATTRSGCGNGRSANRMPRTTV